MTISHPTRAIINEAAARLRDAAATRKPCSPVRDLTGSGAVSLNTWGRLDAGPTVGGRKIGPASLAVRAQLGVDHPDFDVPFDDAAYQDVTRIPLNRLLQPNAETEVAFVLGSEHVALDLFQPVLAEMSLTLDGDVVCSGDGPPARVIR